MLNEIMNPDVNSTITYIVALAIILGIRLLSPIISYSVISVFHKLFQVKHKVQDSGFYEPIKFIITVLGFGIAIYYLKLPEGVKQLYLKIFEILLVLSISQALSNCLHPESTFFTKLETNTNFHGNEALNSFIGKILKGIIYIVAAFIILNMFDINLGGLAAGLGIGGAVVGLAAQDMVKSLMGGFSIITDKPFEIGDFIEVGEFQGTVIDITFRSTRLRAVNNAIISLPNSVVVSEYVKNWSKLENRRLEIELRINLNENTETINRCISKIKTVLRTNEDVIEETVMVHLDRIESDANVIWIVVYINTTDYTKYLEIKEKINCDILSVLERENIELVYPTQKVYTKAL